MTSESKLRDETVRHRHSGAAEFLALAEELGNDPGAMVDPRTELSFAMARRKCSTCPSKEGRSSCSCCHSPFPSRASGPAADTDAGIPRAKWFKG